MLDRGTSQCLIHGDISVSVGRNVLWFTLPPLVLSSFARFFCKCTRITVLLQDADVCNTNWEMHKGGQELAIAPIVTSDASIIALHVCANGCCVAEMSFMIRKMGKPSQCALRRSYPLHLVGSMCHY